MMQSLSDDLVRLVLEFCDSRSSFNFVLCCKQVFISSSRGGFAKHISFDATRDSDIAIFMHRMAKHHRYINVCSMYHLSNPFLWIPTWVKKVEFYFCKITEALNPPHPVITESLKLVSYFGGNSIISIHWEKFPMLKELELINLTVKNVHECKYVKINTRNI